MVDLFREKNWDLVGRRRTWFVVTAVILLICVGALVYRWQTSGSPLNWGIDFTGGGIITLEISPEVESGDEIAALERIRSALEAKDLRVQVQLASSIVGGARDQVQIRTQLPAESEGTAALERQAEAVRESLLDQFESVEVLSSDIVTPVVSRDLTRRALLAILLGCMVIIVWIFARYDFATSLVPKYALCAIFALVHDLIILTGAFALVWWIVDSPFVAAFLTVLGYSVHDTIVIFDRIRENVKLRKRPTFPEVVNLSLLETLARSVNTTLTVEFVLLALYFLGGVTLRSFSGALIIGITSGAWSSIFLASQVLVSWKRREEQPKAARTAARAPSRPAAPEPAPEKPAEKKAPVSATVGQGEGRSAEKTEEKSKSEGKRGKKLRGKKRKRRY